MPNIILVGFEMIVVDTLRHDINKVAKSLKLDSDSVVTVLMSYVKCCTDGTTANPYAIVRCTDQGDLDRMALAINETLGIGVEKELIQAYLEPDPGSLWNQEGR
ncbi:MAG: hypothetical protein V4465_01445 [Patescibacteria group bacterium]